MKEPDSKLEAEIQEILLSFETSAMTSITLGKHDYNRTHTKSKILALIRNQVEKVYEKGYKDGLVAYAKAHAEVVEDRLRELKG